MVKLDTDSVKSTPIESVIKWNILQIYLIVPVS